MKIYTKTGDSGETSLLGGQRVSKSDPRIEAIGTVDELNALIGLIIPQLPKHSAELEPELFTVQNILFDIGAELANLTDRKTKATVPVTRPQHIEQLEQAIDKYTQELAPLTHFILPGGTALSGLLQVTRAVTRRAERRIIELTEDREVNPDLIRYLNRLSDYLFTLARLVNKRSDQPEIIWEANKQ